MKRRKISYLETVANLLIQPIIKKMLFVNLL